MSNLPNLPISKRMSSHSQSFGLDLSRSEHEQDSDVDDDELGR